MLFAAATLFGLGSLNPPPKALASLAAADPGHFLQV